MFAAFSALYETVMYHVAPFAQTFTGLKPHFRLRCLVRTDSGIRHVDCSVDGGIPLHSFQKRESGMAAVTVLRQRRNDYAQRYPGE